VLQVITHLGLGGAENVAFALMRGLAPHFDFAVAAPMGVETGEVAARMRDELAGKNIPFFPGPGLDMKRGGMLAGAWCLKKAIDQFHPDLIHLHTEIPESAYATLAALRPGVKRIPLVRTIHNTVYWQPWRRIGRWCERRMKQSHIAAVSCGARRAFEAVRAESGAGALPAEPQVIYNGVSPPKQSRLDLPPARDPAQRLRLLFAGRLEDQKGADLLPQIVRQTRLPDGVSCELVIHGQGTYGMLLTELAGEPIPGWSIRVEPPVPDLNQRMADFDLLLVPSRYEGQGLVATEALLAGAIVAATDAPGICEAFPEGYPYLCPPGDAGPFAALLTKMLQNRGDWPGVVGPAAAWAKRRFSVPGMCRQYEMLYRNCIKKEL
jgi:glycosyltransferase involved in cell wall biosynthesis